MPRDFFLRAPRGFVRAHTSHVAGMVDGLVAVVGAPRGRYVVIAACGGVYVALEIPSTYRVRWWGADVDFGAHTVRLLTC